jgi:L-ascorbate metabolism protein UlaG (beta-lactamase superfamily)
MKKIALAILVLLAGLTAAAVVALQVRPTVDVAPETIDESPPSNAGLRFSFFGTSTVYVSDGVTTVMTDGFFSRPSWFQFLTRIEPDLEAIDFALGKAPKKIDAIFVAHSHHDHAMDAGLVAQKTGAQVYGSPSTLNVARGQQTPENQLHALKTGQALPVGAFRVTAFETPHSPNPVNPGFIEHEIHTPAKLSEYRMGETYSFFVEHPLCRVLIVPSANVTPHVFDALRADVVVLGIGALGKQSAGFVETYWNEAVRKPGAKQVIPVHWDDFTRPLREPLVPLPIVMDDMGVALERLRALARRDAVTLRFAPVMREMALC